MDYDIPLADRRHVEKKSPVRGQVVQQTRTSNQLETHTAGV